MVLQRISSSSILVTKFLPEIRRNVIPRQRLFASLDRGLKEGKVILVVAAPGYGKSTLLSSFIASQDLPAIWYRTDKADADPVVLVNGLLAAVLRCLPDEATETQGWFGTGPEPWRGSLATLLAALGRNASRELVLVMDDFDAASDAPSANACLEILLGYLPPNVRLCIASRAQPKLSYIARLRQYGGLLELGEWELSFTQAEVQEFLSCCHGLTIDAEQVGRLVTRIGGWPAVLPMLGERISQQGTADIAELMDLAVARNSMYDYFAQCIVDGQSPHVQEFLERSSILQQLTPPLCETILEAADARETLEHLQRNHIFLSLVSDREEVYTYHSLFREFLQTRLRRRIGEAEVTVLHQVAARYFAERDMVEAALYHAYQACDWAHAAALIRKGAPGAIRAGNMETVLRWMDMLPKTAVESDPWLLLHMGRIFSFKGRLSLAHQVLSQARAVAGPQPEPGLEARLLYELGKLSYLVGQSEESDRQFHMALSLAAEEGDAALASKVWAGLTVCYAVHDRLSEAIAAAEQSLSCAPHIADVATRSHARLRAMRHLSWAYLRCGRIKEAIETAQQICPLDSERVKNVVQASVLCVLGAARAAKGELEQALEDLCIAKEMSDKYGFLNPSEAASLAKATTLAMMNRLEEAEDVYQSLELPLHDEPELIYLRLLQGRLDDAASVARRQLQQAEARVSRGKVARLLALLGAIELQRGDLSAAEHLLDRATDEFASMDLRYDLAGTRLYQARLCFLADDADKGVSLLIEAFEYAAREDLYNFFLWHPAVVTPLCAEALRRGILPSYARTLAQRRLGPVLHQSFLPFRHDDAPEPNAEDEQVADESVVQMPNDTIALTLVLKDCQDQEIRCRILDAVSHAWINPGGLARLRDHHCLTWREIDIFIQYYLLYYLLGQRSGQEEPGDSSPRREQLARSLYLADNTLRSHISSIRRKIGVLGVRDGMAVFRWALDEGIVAQVEGARSLHGSSQESASGRAFA
ncbi:MAG: hypothetical protein EPO21_14155 [Chloroflexota bacterium]|nr:MAG: hypothetical protein EPO21_14155 [Chloroflexota bacterium]